MDITYDYYRIFCHVAQYGSFSKAASALMRGQPNITKAISNLETQLGCKLFVRSSRGVTLTDEGKRLYAHARIAFEHLNMAESEILSEQKLDGGLVSIATTEIALYGCVLDAMVAFSADHPNVKLKLTNFTNLQAMQSLKSGLSDFAILSIPGATDENYRVHTIRTFREVLCCKKGYFGGNKVNANDALRSCPFISLSKETYTYKFDNAYLFSQGIHREPDIEVATAEQLLPMVKSGMGIAFIADILADEALRSGELEELSLQEPPDARTISLVEDQKRNLSFVAKAFLRYLLQTGEKASANT